MWIRHVASSVNSKLNHLSFDFRLFKNMSIDHRRIEEFMKSLCPLSAMKCLAVDHPRSACDTAALTYEKKHIRTAVSKEHGRSFLLARL